jgi:hypothetical protein
MCASRPSDLGLWVEHRKAPLHDDVRIVLCPRRKHRFGLLTPCAPIQNRHATPIYCGKREGRVTAPGGPDP